MIQGVDDVRYENGYHDAVYGPQEPQTCEEQTVRSILDHQNGQITDAATFAFHISDLSQSADF